MLEVKRQGIHMLAGFLLISLRFLPYWAILCLTLFGILFNLFFLPLIFPSIMRGTSGDRRGVVFYPVAVAFLVILFPHHPGIVAGGWALLAFGDGMATMIGKLGKPVPLRWNPQKTVQGATACFIAGAAACVAAIFFVEPELTSQDPNKWIVAAITAAAVATWVESLPLPINDNLTVPLSGALVLWSAGFVEADQLDQLSGLNMLFALLVNGILASALTSFRVIHGSATWAGVILGSILAYCGGWHAYSLLVLFFVAGTLATKHGYHWKSARGIAQEDEGRRGARHVVANCGVPVLFAFFAAGTQYHEWMMIGLVASLATAMMDTLSSELGQVYGRHPVLPTTGEMVPVGTEGAISMEGTLLGLAGAIVMALLAWIFGAVGYAAAIPIIVLSAFCGSSAESVLGAMMRFDFTWKNELLNFANTLIGGGLAFFIAFQTIDISKAG
ncbi:MAG: DUF92 domain-containing protein [Candidatus Omnitrophica bacterium]|nr:DUF92 domain-containing protein [Candidatus Omnitrophota bacterium]MCA9433930.1 DUF92 domain-containing protein [Candidatus Omnitrophota bacterium]